MFRAGVGAAQRAVLRGLDWAWSDSPGGLLAADRGFPAWSPCTQPCRAYKCCAAGTVTVPT